MRTYCEGWKVETVFGVNEINCFRRGNIWEVYDNQAGMLFSASDSIGADNAIKNRINEIKEAARVCGLNCTVTRIK